MNKEIGQIELILGPMFSGKTTRLIETIRKYSYNNKRTAMVNFYADNRYTEKSEVVTHDLIKYDSISCKTLGENIETLRSYDAIGIDEGQFFPDLVEVCDNLCRQGKTIVVAALSGDFRMEPFPNVAKLISKADKIKLMKAYCFNCHKIAGFTLRIVESEEKFLIGAGEAYKPVCKKCHVIFTKQKKEGTKNTDLQENEETEKKGENAAGEQKGNKSNSSSPTLNHKNIED